MMISESLFNNVAQPKLPITDFKAYREVVLSGTPKQKAQFVARVPVHVEAFVQAREFVDAMLDQSENIDGPGGLWIIGKGGLGKTSLLNDVYERNPPYETETTRYTPILTLSFEGRPVISTILIKMMLQLGQDPDALHYKGNDNLRDHLIDAMPECGVRAIMFDEAHHLLINTQAKRNVDRLGGVAGDFIKRFYDDAHVAYIFSGTPGLQELYEKDDQVSTRWPGTLHLKEFLNDEKFRGVLKAIDDAIPLPEPAGLALDPLVGKIFASSRGNFRLLKKLLSKAVFLAASDKSLSIKEAHLQKAHFNLFCAVENPFK